jgi:hypothetical protein
MDPVITTQLESIRVAFAAGASADDVRAGSLACRTLAAVLESQPGQPLAASPPAPSTNPSQLAALLPQLGQLDVDQILDLVIARLRMRLPPGTAMPTARSYSVPALRLGGGA